MAAIQQPKMSSDNGNALVSITECSENTDCSSLSLPLPIGSHEKRWQDQKDPLEPRNWPVWRKAYDFFVSCALLEYVTILSSNTGVCTRHLISVA
jgi:hypothetical protein